MELGLTLTQFTEETRAKLETALPDHWSHGNPVDVIGDTTPKRYREAVDACLSDKEVDGVLAILAPLALSEPTAIAREVVELAAKSRKPVLACWMGGSPRCRGPDPIRREPGAPFRRAGGCGGGNVLPRHASS